MGESNIRELLGAYLDGELSAEERARVDAALAADPALSAELKALRSVDGLFRERTAPKAPEGFADSVGAALPEPARSAGGLGGGEPRLSRGPLRMALPLAAAAAIVVVTGLAWQLRTANDGRYPVASAPESAFSMDTLETLDALDTVGALPPDDADAAVPMAEGESRASTDALASTTAARTAQPVPPAAAADAAPVAEPLAETAPVLLHAPPVQDLRVIDDTRYLLRDGRWTPADYDGEALTPLSREDARWQSWLARDTRSEMGAWPEAIVVQMDGEWYEVAALDNSTEPAPVE